MGIRKADLNDSVDRFVDYDFEEVMFRWEAGSRMIFRKFYGKEEDLVPVDHTSKLFNDALNFGAEISAVDYARGKPLKQ